MLHLDLLRHGESERSGTLRGSLDDALTVQGWTQMQQSIVTELSQFNHMHGQDEKMNSPWQAIWTSPLQRCHHFAQNIAQQLNIPLYSSAKLQEMHFGDWEGISTQTLYEQVPEQLAQFWQSPTQYTPPNAESMQAFMQRVRRGMLDIAQKMQALQMQRVLVVSHAGVIKLLKCFATQTDLDLILTQSAELGQLHHFYVDVIDSQLQFGQKQLQQSNQNIGHRA